MLIVLACLSASLNCPQGLSAGERKEGREQRKREEGGREREEKNKTLDF